jgi:hypothetical protein
MSDAWSGRPDIDDETARRLATSLHDGKWSTLAEALVELTAAIQALDRAAYGVRKIGGQILLDAAMAGNGPDDGVDDE